MKDTFTQLNILRKEAGNTDFIAAIALMIVCLPIAIPIELFISGFKWGLRFGLHIW
jgi:hypothetical protein